MWKIDIEHIKHFSNCWKKLFLEYRVNNVTFIKLIVKSLFDFLFVTFFVIQLKL